MAVTTKHIFDSTRKTCEGCGRQGVKTYNWMCKGCAATSRKGMRLIWARKRRGTKETVPCLTTLIKSIEAHTCYLCGDEFVPKGRDRSRFCGRACGLRWTGFKTKAKANGLRVKVRTARKICVSCNGRHQERGIYCSYDCQPIYVSTAPQEMRCKECEVIYKPPFTMGRPSVFCSKQCADLGKIRQRKINKARREARKRGCGTSESIDPIKVFERDAWRCGICGAKTHRAKRGTYHPRAPELDHIVAIANGGPHTWANVQCSCRECNGRKGATDYGQIPLFAMA